jgi:hypothetical protein
MGSDIMLTRLSSVKTRRGTEESSPVLNGRELLCIRGSATLSILEEQLCYCVGDSGALQRQLVYQRSKGDNRSSVSVVKTKVETRIAYDGFNMQ